MSGQRWPRYASRAEDRYCFYCSTQYANHGTFKRHIIAEHSPWFARRLLLLTQEEDLARLAALSPEAWRLEMDAEHAAALRSNRARLSSRSAAAARAARREAGDGGPRA